jgi:hypothetical protein
MNHPLATFCAVFAAGTLAAQSLTYGVELIGAQEVPLIVTTGIGNATLTLDAATNTVTISGTYTNLMGPVSAVDLYATARRGATATAALGLTPSGGTTGTFAGNGVITPAQTQAILDGLTYLNVRTAMFPGGEVRGQVDSVPGSGSPSARLLRISGAAAPGNNLFLISCPPDINNRLILLSLALPAGQVLPLPAVLACTPPASIGISLAITPLAIPGPSVMLAIPASVGSFELGVQCVSYPPSLSCLDLSSASRVAFRP